MYSKYYTNAAGPILTQASYSYAYSRVPIVPCASITRHDPLCRPCCRHIIRMLSQVAAVHGSMVRRLGPYMLCQTNPVAQVRREVRACAITPVVHSTATFARISFFLNGINSTSDDGYIIKSPYK